MEAASARVRELPERLRARGFERECERLRPLGEAYVLRRFGRSLDRADAEDAVAEVVIRLHRQAAQGRAPANLRAAFFTAVRNAAIDQLRSRSARPTVPLEVVAEAPLRAPGPAERAEAGEEASRLREALARMRPNYREAITLRFGLGLSVPEIAERLEISLPAAKKLVLRATAQVRKRLAALEGEEFCPEMRDLARRAVFDREAAGLLDEAESRLLHAHLAHCGRCRSFLAHLHEDLHGLAGAVLALGVGRAVGLGAGRLGRARELVEKLGEGVGIVHEKARLAAFRASGALSSGDGSGSGILVGSSQKVAAVCAMGAASAATCLASGVIGPGIGAGVVAHHAPVPPAKVRGIEGRAAGARGHHLVVPPPVVAAPPAAEAAVQAPATPTPRPRKGKASSKESGGAAAKASRKSPAEETEAEFGFESRAQGGGSTSGASSGSTSEVAATAESATTSETSTPSTSSSSGSSSTSGSSAGSSSGSGGTDFGGFEK